MRRKTSTKEKRPLRIAGYVRVSSQRQATEGDSLVAQEHEIQQEVEHRKRRESWDVGSLEFYVDKGRSAKDQNRPELQRLKRDIAAGKIDIVCVFKLDRITRSLKDFVDLWAFFEENDVDVISLREQFDTSTPSGTAMLQLVMIFAQLERSMTAERTVSILKDRADRGLWNGGHILGYRSVKSEPGRLEIDEDGAAIVRRIFASYDEHGTAGAVTRELSDLGIRYPTFETRSGKIRGGKLFTKQKVVGILRNPVYIGKMRWGEAEYDGNHPALIGTEQFERVNASLTAMVKRRINVRQPSARTYLLSGLLRCSCGAHLVGACAHGSRGKSYYYVCTRQTHEGGKYSCSAPRIPAIALESAVIGRVRELGRVLEARERIVREAVAHLDGETERMQDQSDVVRRQLAKNRADTGRLVEVLKSLGAKGLSSVQSELERLEQEGEALEAQLAVLSKQQAPVERITDDARKFVENWEDIGEVITAANEEERKELLQHYIEVIELRSTDPKGRTGTYALRLFPEVRPDRSFDWDDSDAFSGLQMTNGDDTPEDGIAVLTQDARAVRTTSGKLPR